MKDVFIIGSKGIPANYGGFETFVDKLTENIGYNNNIKIHVACKNNISEKYIYNNASCFSIKVPNIGSAQAVLYDILALKKVIYYITKNSISHPTVYILACRIGPFFRSFVNKIHKSCGRIIINPDGHEWKRSKWNPVIKKYWKHSERLMVKYSDLVICDSRNIEEYINNEYKKYQPKTTYISYGADISNSVFNDDDQVFINWLKEFGLTPNNYYLVVGRFVPENNYETIIKEFMKVESNKDLVIITTKNDKFYNELNKKLNFQKDKRIKFVGTVYEKELLKKIRENSFAYIHGHEVGGTNPSLLEALSSTKINLLYDVCFNKEVGKNSCFYWNKKSDSLKVLIEFAEKLSIEEINQYSDKCKRIICEDYNWDDISKKYMEVFVDE